MPVVLGPSVAAATSIVISPNVDYPVEQELVGGLDGTGIWLDREGNENLFPTPTYEETWAESPDTEGARRVGSRPQNPVGQGRVLLGAHDSAAFYGFLANWQETVEAIRHYGGTLVYTPVDGTEITFSIESLRITTLPQDGVLQQVYMAFSEFEITYGPYGELPSETLVTNANGSDPLLIFDVGDVDGSAPARAVLTLLDQATTARDHVEVGVTDPRWDASTWDHFLSKTDLTATGFAGSSTTRSGSHSANVWRATLLTASVIVCGTGSQPHKGRHRPKLRVYGAGTGTQRVRLKWRIGEGQWTNNDWVTLPGLANWYEVDLGLIDIPEAEVGTQSWEGQIEAYSSVVGDTLDVDYMKLLPAYRYCKARAAQIQGAALAVSAYDTFNQAGVATIIGTTADLGGVWAEGGDADDFTSTGTGVETAQRTAVSDANYYTGQYALLGTTTATDVSVQVDFKLTAPFAGDGLVQGVVARYTDASNNVFGAWYLNGGAVTLVIYKVITGTPTLIASAPASLVYGNWSTIRLVVNAAGVASLYFGSQGSTPSLVCSGQDAALATGGTLATGKRGMYDARPNANAVTRNYDNVIIADTLPAAGHVLNSGKEFKLHHDRALTEPTSGTSWSRRPIEGKHLTLPHAGREGLTTRIVVSHHPLDTDELPATDVTNALRADLEVTPRVLLTGRA